MLTWHNLQTYCLAKREATEDFPFGDDTPVYKVVGKMFALLGIGIGSELRLTLKCDPEHALFLRETYPAVQGGYYMNKRYWNTVTLDGSIPDGEIFTMIDESYRLVVGGLKKADRARLLSPPPDGAPA